VDRATRRTFLQLPAAAACAGLLPAGAAEPNATGIWYDRPAAAVDGSRRWLDLDEAVAGVTWRTGEEIWTPELLSSSPDQVIALRIALHSQGGRRV
jgi:hypothetical protein